MKALFERVQSLRPLAVEAVAHFNTEPDIDPLTAGRWAVENLPGVKASGLDDPLAAMVWLCAVECDRRFSSLGGGEPELADWSDWAEGMPREIWAKMHARFVVVRPGPSDLRLHRKFEHGTLEEWEKHAAWLQHCMTYERFRLPLPVVGLPKGAWRRLLILSYNALVAARGQRRIDPEDIASRTYAEHSAGLSDLTITAALLGLKEAVTRILDANQPRLEQVEAHLAAMKGEDKEDKP
jgi:hypothetical protein